MNFLADDVLTTGAGLNTGAGTGGGFTDLLQNKLFLQYLSGAGSALQQGQPIGPALNQVTQQNISAQNYVGLLKKLLGPDESKGTFSNKGLSLNIPASELKSGAFLGDNPLNTISNSTTQTPTPAPTNTINPNHIGTVNPFVTSQPDISASDLAGLTTQDIGNVLSGVMSVKQLEQKRLSDISDAMYKNIHGKYLESQILGNTPSITIPGTDIKLTRDEYIKWYAAANKDERTAAVKNFEYAKAKGYKGDFMQFQDSAKTTNQKDYAAAVEGGYSRGFNQWLLDMKKAGATNLSIDTKAETKRALDVVEREGEVLKPDFHQKVLSDIQKTKKSEYNFPTNTQDLMKKYNVTEDEAIVAGQQAMIRKEMDRRIKQSFPDAKYVRNKGWYVGDKLKVRDPYGE